MKNLDLNVLGDGKSTGLSVINGCFLAEAASVCLNNFKHAMSVTMSLGGDIVENYDLIRLSVDEQVLNSFLDMQEATEYGAMGIAVAIVHDQLKLKVIRSWKGTGFDYWAGEKSQGLPFQNKLRVEISGKLEGTDPEIQARLREKLLQSSASDALDLPACAIVVEFSNPKTLIGLR